MAAATAGAVAVAAMLGIPGSVVVDAADVAVAVGAADAAVVVVV